MLAKLNANKMAKHEEFEHSAVFGEFPTAADSAANYPTPEQIKANLINWADEFTKADQTKAAQAKAAAEAIAYSNEKQLSDGIKAAGTAIKFDTDKLPLNLLSTEAMNQTAAVLKFGAIKYAEHNWRKGFAWSRPLAAAMRHITAFNDGEDTDPESGLSHLAHAACCIMFLLEFEKTHPELDDRYKSDVQTLS